MVYDVILSQHDQKYLARVKEWPEVTVEEDSRDSAIQQIKAHLVEYLAHPIEVIQIDVPVMTNAGHPWHDKFGWFQDDPTFDDLQVEIAAYRKEINGQMAE